MEAHLSQEFKMTETSGYSKLWQNQSRIEVDDLDNVTVE